MCLAWTMSCGSAKVSVARILNLHLRCWLIHVQDGFSGIRQQTVVLRSRSARPVPLPLYNGYVDSYLVYFSVKKK